MKKKYKDRKGKLILLDDKEYLDYPFNSKLTLIEEEKPKRKKKIMEEDKDGY